MQEERLRRRAALAGGAVGGERVGRAARRDRRAQSSAGRRAIPPGVSSWNARRPPSKCPTTVCACRRPTSVPADVRRVAGERDVRARRVVDAVSETGWPPLTSSKWSPPTRRETKIAWLPLPVSSDQATHGDGRRRPGSACRPRRAGPRRLAGGGVQACTRPRRRLSLGAGAEAVRAGRVERVRLAGGAAADRDPVEAAVGGGVGDGLGREHLLVAAQADACSAPCSYQTTHGTVSLGPVNAMSGSMPSRVGSMFSVGSVAPAGLARPC